MDIAEALAVLIAGVAAGTINTVVGSGTLVTFPVLLAVGLPPVTANVTNSIGLVPGSVSGAIGYRAELAGQRGRVLRFGAASLSGGIVGAIALLTLPDDAFRAIVPVFIVAALALIVVQPRLKARLEARREAGLGAADGRLVWSGVFLTGVYGGYFGAAQGILLLALLGAALPGDLHRANALKNVLAALVNGVSGVIFIVLADPAWDFVAVLAAGAIVGGQIGGRYGRRLPPDVLRGVIIAVGLVAIAVLLL